MDKAILLAPIENVTGDDARLLKIHGDFGRTSGLASEEPRTRRALE